jgi:hypothetical protein
MDVILMCGGSGGKSGGGGGGSTNGDAGQPGEVFRQAALQQRRNMNENIATIENLYGKAETSAQRKMLREQKREYQKKIGEIEREYRSKTGEMLIS